MSDNVGMTEQDWTKLLHLLSIELGRVPAPFRDDVEDEAMRRLSGFVEKETLPDLPAEGLVRQIVRFSLVTAARRRKSARTEGLRDDLPGDHRLEDLVLTAIEDQVRLDALKSYLSQLPERPLSARQRAAALYALSKLLPENEITLAPDLANSYLSQPESTRRSQLAALFRDFRRFFREFRSG